MPKKIDDSKIIELYNKKVPVNQIAKKLGYSKTTILKYLREYNIWEDRFPYVDSKKIINLYNNDKLSVEQISKQLDISKNSVTNHLHKNNISLRDNSLLSETDKKEVTEHYENGLLIRDISTMFDCSETTISNCLKEADIDINNHTVFGMVDNNEVLKYYKRCYSLVKTATNFNMSQGSVKKILYANGITNFRSKILTSEYDDKIIELYNQNYSATRIGQMFGFSHTTILKRLKFLNVEVRDRVTSSRISRNVDSIPLSASFFGAIHNSSKTRNLDFKITKKYIYDLFILQNKKCLLSGLELSLPQDNQDFLNRDFTASLDRIDSSKGYIKGNVQWVHKKINIMKQNMTDDEFIKWCNLVSGNSRHYQYL